MNTPPGTPAGLRLSSSERKAQALQRLETTRTRLIQQLYPHDPDGGAPGTAPDSTGTARLLMALAGRLQRDGWARGAWRAARALGRQWFKRQPWHASVALVANTLAAEVRPVVRRHPWAVVGASAALGAALVLLRPWASHTVRRQVHGLPAQVGSLLWQQLAQAPVQLALVGALSAWLAERGRRAPSAATGRDAPPPPAP